MTTKEKIAVMQAYLDGKQIQIALKDKEDWEDYFSMGEPRWDWVGCDYRIKPEEEKPQRMTNRQLAEWLGRGFGERTWWQEWCNGEKSGGVTEYVYRDIEENNIVYEGIRIRPWGSDEWIEPTVDIYERDCKGAGK